MMDPPGYFEAIRARAAARWEQLEDDPELAGPWWQLFMQIQSPRHVLSELLQNADDARATKAVARLEGDSFTFEHDGVDFTESDFAALCRFGYSNKRVMHTIGFRGVGFKSTFSLGSPVELHTPSLSVRFLRDRFTEPAWLGREPGPDKKTRIGVQIQDQSRRKELEENLSAWKNSSLSLLFFRSLRTLKINDDEIGWQELGPGPVADSQWLAPPGRNQRRVLMIRSKAEAFPEEAIEEIRQERRLTADESMELPPCTVEIVLGAGGRLFVVLPTGVKADLPFAVNAPFVQDPAREKIKDPSTSPTNTWLLKRTGRLAGETMLAWLRNEALSIEERAGAYDLLTDVCAEEDSLEYVVANMVEQSFAETVADCDILLTDAGEVVTDKQAIALPAELLDVWSANVAASLFGGDGALPLARYVSPSNRSKLRVWDIIESVGQRETIKALEDQSIPRPRSWRQLLKLWSYLAPWFTGVNAHPAANSIAIVPVEGGEDLYPAAEVVRLGESRLLRSDDDWRFLAEFVVPMDPNWPRYITKQKGGEGAGESLNAEARAADLLLVELGLAETSDVSDVFCQVADQFFARDQCGLEECVRLTHIGAKLGVSVGADFRYITRAGMKVTADQEVLVDLDGSLEELLPEGSRARLLLHPSYRARFESCTRDEWRRWIASGQSRLQTAPPLESRERSVNSRQRIGRVVRERGYDGELYFRFVTDEFVLEDWDFRSAYWQHWDELATEDSGLWVGLLNRVFEQPKAYWTRARAARAKQVSTTGSRALVTREDLLPAWVVHFRSLPCLPDTRGVPRHPEELLRRTPETEGLLDVEPFIDAHLDTEANRELLDLLGVRRTATGPERVLDRLRALARASHPPAAEVDKWYRRLDQLVHSGSSEGVAVVRDAFAREALILTTDGGWATTSAVFLNPDEAELPNAPAIRPSVIELSLWRRVGVADRPRADQAIDWLRTLESGALLSEDDRRRVRAILMQYPVRVWGECGHWLSLAGRWARTEDLDLALTMQSLVAWRHLHAAVRERTADLQKLSVEVANAPPFGGLDRLAQRLEERFDPGQAQVDRPKPKAWMQKLGALLQRVVLDSEDETRRVRELALRLTATTWIACQRLFTVPYLDGVPAGTPRDLEVIWELDKLYVTPQSAGKLARLVPAAFGKHFENAAIQSALDYSFERSPTEIREYVEANFDLAAEIPLSGEPKEEREGCLSPGQYETPVVPGDRPDEQLEGADPPKTTAVPEADETEPDTSGEATVDLDGAEESPTDQGTDRHQSDRKQATPREPPLIERFAQARGFQATSEGCFEHSDGRTIVKSTEGRLFPWELHFEGGELHKYLLPKEHCLEHEQMPLKADVWAALDSHPELYALILVDSDGLPIEVSGVELRKLHASGGLRIHPDQYRLQWVDTTD